MMDASVSYGIPFIDDTNGPNPEGVGVGVMNATAGRRHGPATGYLEPVLHSKNLTLITDAKVLKLNIKNKNATGVIFKHNGQTYSAEASSEIVLCAGAIGTPKLLMLSGIGDSEELEEVGIKPEHYLPGVGKNLQDHPILESMIFEAHESLAPFTGNYTGSTLQWKSNTGLKASDLMVFACQVPVPMPEIVEKYGPLGENLFCFLPALVNVKSRGYVKLRDSNPDTPPEIQGNLLSEEQDVEAMVSAIELCMDIADQLEFKKFIKNWIAPRKRLTTRAEILDFIRDSLTSYIHPAGTCRMGSDEYSVVSDRLFVHGLRGLRIADASIMPEVTSSNTQAPVLMIAEFASREILSGINQTSKQISHQLS